MQWTLPPKTPKPSCLSAAIVWLNTGSWPWFNEPPGWGRNALASRHLERCFKVQQLKDTFNREFYYLRLSITDVCNFRCSYCLPDGYKQTSKTAFLSPDETRRIAHAFIASGTDKIRLTGGEPTLRRDFLEIAEGISGIAGLRTLALTTNGYRMAKDVARWRAAGVNALNVSVDSLDPRLFHSITGENKLREVMAGIDAAFTAGYDKVKVNTVLMKGLNDRGLNDFLGWIKERPIQLRFIELMQTGEMGELFATHHLSGGVIRDILLQQGWQPVEKQRNAGPAQVFRHEDYCGEVGLIMPYEKDFCQSCNRLRVSATGKLHLCLFGDEGINLRDLLTEDQQLPLLQQRLQQALLSKKQTHFLHAGNSGSTPHLASLGG